MQAEKLDICLQKGIGPGDQSWSYEVAQLPSSELTDRHGLVKLITLLSSPKGASIRLRFETAPSSRVTHSHDLHLFLMMSFANFSLRHTATKSQEAAELATPTETADYIARLLKTGIQINGRHYSFFGHSNAQLKSRSCFMFAAAKHVVRLKVEQLGDFSKMTSTAKKVKRLGLLFSPAEMSMELDPACVHDIEDVVRRKHIFTDGCGFIAPRLAKMLAKERSIVYRNARYLPSVFQVRYRGYKGVLQLAPALEGEILVQFRRSMYKLCDVPDCSIGIVDYSKPYSFGYLNDEIVVLLHALGISADILINKQRQYLNFLRTVLSGHGPSTFQFLAYIGQFDLGEQWLLGHTDDTALKVKRLVHREVHRFSNRRKAEQRCRIMIPESRLLFGICDPSANGAPALGSGTCFVRVMDPTNGQARTLINMNVLVTRNPCLHPGDLQKFRAVDVPQFSHLRDCIVFPIVGDRPSADLMSGGDLDGDRFIVIWDAELIPMVVSEPAIYPIVTERVSFSAVADDERAEYFARYSSTNLGRIRRLHSNWARLRGSMSPECQELNHVYSQALDGALHAIPRRLQELPKANPKLPPFILDILHEDIKAGIEAISKTSVPSLTTSGDIMDLLLSRSSIAIPELDLIQLTVRWCRWNEQDFRDYVGFFDFGAVSDEQRKWLLGELPPTRNCPSLVNNGLLQSKVVSLGDLQRFGLDQHSQHWRCVFDSSCDRMARFMSVTCRSLELFHKKLILIQPDDRLVVAIYVPSQIIRASDHHVGSQVRVFAMPQSQGADSAQYRVTPTTVDYRLFCDQSSFQLYDQRRANTFVFLRAGEQDGALPKATRGPKQKGRPPRRNSPGPRPACSASIALDKISKAVQTHVGRINRTSIMSAEIYVISNRDTTSLAVLEEWSQSVDAEEQLPLFARPSKAYMARELDNLQQDPSKVASTALQFAKAHDASVLRALESADGVHQLLALFESYHEHHHVQAAYLALLAFDTNGGLGFARSNVHLQPTVTDLTVVLLKFLQTAPYLIPTFVNSQSWTRARHELQDDFEHIGQVILKQLVLTASTLRFAMRQSFALVLQNLQRLSLAKCAELFELIALVIPDPELACDLLYDCIQPELSRLLAGHVQVEHIMNSFAGVALNHIDKMFDRKPDKAMFTRLQENGMGNDGHQLAVLTLRLDSPVSIRVGDHIRMRPTQPPQNAPNRRLDPLDTVILRHTVHGTLVRCLHMLPHYAEECDWEVIACESFVTSKTIFDAVLHFHSRKKQCCQLYSVLLGFQPSAKSSSTRGPSLALHASLDKSQQVAVEAAMSHECTYIWGPPRTGKKRTIIALTASMQEKFKDLRILIAAPTHAAVDDLLKAYMAQRETTDTLLMPLRVSTQLHKVTKDIQQYTCDSITGHEITEDIAERSEARDRVRQARLVFTTCAGAGLGFLRFETFEIVIIHNAAQLSGPEVLVPLVKNCQRAVFVGDHAQPRVQVGKHALLAEFDVSHFEKQLQSADPPGVARLTLHTTYQLHPDICEFVSREFYQHQLVAATRGSLLSPKNTWPWKSRLVFVQSYAAEDIGFTSKRNEGQTDLCSKVYATIHRETSMALREKEGDPVEPPSIFIVTPYTRQKYSLRKALPKSRVCTVKEFLGHTADIAIFVSVRSNPHNEIGPLLSDKKLLAGIFTRVKSGIVFIGNEATLTQKSLRNKEEKILWRNFLQNCIKVHLVD